MTCIIKEPKGEHVIRTYTELYRFMVDNADIFASQYWIAKCVGNDEETVMMRSLLLDAIDEDEIVFYKDGSFGPRIPEEE